MESEQFMNKTKAKKKPIIRKSKKAPKCTCEHAYVVGLEFLNQKGGIEKCYNSFYSKKSVVEFVSTFLKNPQNVTNIEIGIELL